MNQNSQTKNNPLIPQIIPPSPYHVPVRRLVFENGMPVLTHEFVVNKNSLPEIRLHAISQPYEGEKRIDKETGETYVYFDPRYEGMTKAEVMEHKLADLAASGDLDAIKEIHDRLNGKPKQQVESKNLNLSYEDYLEEIARQEGLTNDDLPPPLDL